MSSLLDLLNTPKADKNMSAQKLFDELDRFDGRPHAYEPVGGVTVTTTSTHEVPLKSSHSTPSTPVNASPMVNSAEKMSGEARKRAVRGLYRGKDWLHELA
jgi:hypothetical protein